MNIAQKTVQGNATQPVANSVYVQRRRTVLALLVAVIAMTWFAVTHPAAPATEMVTVTVAQGESLWSLAEQFAPENQDPREWIYEVTTINNLETSSLIPGMRLTVPTPASE